MTDAVNRSKALYTEQTKQKQKFKYTLLKRPTTTQGKLLSGETIVMQSNVWKTVHDEMDRLNLEPHEGFQYSIFDRDLTNDFNRLMFGPPERREQVSYGDG